jgi:short-subunit dehydrogenase
MDLTGKVAVVTGGSMGIGEALGRAFADRGATVVLTSRDRERAEAARARMAHPERILATACDVRYREGLERLLALTLHNFGRVDVWVNNAGAGFMEAVAPANMAELRRLFDVDLFGAIEGMQVVAPVMQQQHSGTIINISSVAGHITVPYMALYCAAKAALNAAGKGARMELGRYGIHVMTVCPGFVGTDFGKNAYKGAERMRLSAAGNRGFSIAADRVARAVLRGYERRSREVVVPWYYRIVIKMYQFFPSILEYGMARMLRPADQVLAEAEAARKR